MTFLPFPINHLLQLVSVGSFGLILFKCLFQEAFFSIGSQQQENWDGRPNSLVVSADWDMTPPPVFNGYVTYQGRVSIRVSNKLKMFNDQGKRNFERQMYTTHNSTGKIQFFYVCSAQRSSTPERETWLFLELTDARTKKVRAENLIGQSPCLRNSTVPILLRLNSPAFPILISTLLSLWCPRVKSRSSEVTKSERSNRKFRVWVVWYMF